MIKPVPRPSASVRTKLAPRPLGDQSGEPERASVIHAKHLRLTTGKVGNDDAHWSLRIYGELILADASGVESLASCP
jgi:hypothetical protein